MLLLGLQLLWVGGGAAYAQQTLTGPSLTNKRTRTLAVQPDTVRVDTLSLIPGSVFIETTDGKLISSDHYHLSPTESELYWKSRPFPDTVILKYQVYPYDFSKPYYHKHRDSLRQEADQNYITYYGKPPSDQRQTSQVNWNGSLSRAISFGNKQDVVVNSDMNLQISGMLTDHIEVTGAITDRNIPIQPEGNTQEVQRFDNVYLQLKGYQSMLRAGDITLQSDDSYFMKFQKQARGARFQNTATIDSHQQVQTNVGLSLSKGKYARNQFQGEEGNQGPYQLKGNNNESYIIVLAGSEKVYIDGEVLERGEEHDYIIDYNVGQITFMPSRPITKDSRIVVEFEYRTRTYMRSLVHLSETYKGENGQLQFKMYAEQDHKNQTETELSDQAKSKMAQIGDSSQQAFVQNLTQDEFNADRIQYQLIDTTVNGTTYDSVFVYASEPTEDNVYNVGFTKVGPGKGNYIIDQNLANGRVYKWVPPSNGQPQGQFAPVTPLVTPKKKHLYTLSGQYDLGQHATVDVETSLSNQDQNTFSGADDGDNIGVATKVGLSSRQPLSEDTTTGWQLNTDLHFENVQKNFRALERYRAVEFQRNWNTPAQTANVNEQLGDVTLGISKGQRYALAYNFSTLLQGSKYQGFKHGGDLHITQGGFEASLNGSFLNTESSQQTTQFFRPHFQLSQVVPLFNGFKIGGDAQRERNQIFPIEQDTLAPSSFSFDEYKIYIKSLDTATNQYQLQFKQRRNAAPVKTQFQLANLRNIWSVDHELLSNRHHRLRWGASYREFHVHTPSRTSEQPDQSVLGRAEYNGTLFNGFIRANTLYELGQGQVQQRQFTYQKVPQGNGYYTWIDRDDDNKKEQDEFEKAYYNDQANYIRILLPTDAYEQTDILRFNQTLNLTPKALWEQQKGWKRFLTRFSTRSYIRLTRKTLQTADLAFYSPVVENIPDTSLVSLNSQIRNTLYFNRTGSDFGMDFTWIRNRDKNFLINGAQTRLLSEKQVKMRWNLTDNISLRSTYSFGERQSQSFSAPQNFQIDFQQVTPSLSYFFKKAARISVEYKYAYKENELSQYRNELNLGGEHLVMHDMSVNLRYTKFSRGNISARFSYVIMGFQPDANANSTIAFSMLEGLQPGQNMVWNVSWKRQLKNNMEINLHYEGRNSEDAKAVHIGRAEVRYLF